MRESRARYQRHPAYVKAARLRAVQTVTEWGLAPLAESVRLIISELVTNAVHYGTGRQIVVSYHVDSVRLRGEVRDLSEAMPSRRQATERSESGRGLGIVELTADRWGVDVKVIGKTVWFEIDLPLASETPPAAVGPASETPPVAAT
ncbi:ATP-binding protein [Kitasatospora sp. NPDC057541]|uniref:ATP-binding protein n=1 Tax=unclassified Kitasatospora TaxID=2633591 RepID=UPI0036AA21CE